jgi:hypothetical protein
MTAREATMFLNAYEAAVVLKLLSPRRLALSEEDRTLYFTSRAKLHRALTHAYDND